MKRALGCVLSVLALSAGANAAPPAVHPETLTIVLDFKGPHSDKSIEEMKTELRSILGSTGLDLAWRSPEQAAASAVNNLVVVSFKGKCILEPVGYLYDERGPLAFTHTSDGEMLPFSEVACDTVTASVRSAMFKGDYSHADLLLGRALGRVVAHELVHILTHSSEHAKEGVQKEALSGNQLIADRLRLSEKDLLRLQHDLKE
jgi:hypothetical protein